MLTCNAKSIRFLSLTHSLSHFSLTQVPLPFSPPPPFTIWTAKELATRNYQLAVTEPDTKCSRSALARFSLPSIPSLFLLPLLALSCSAFHSCRSISHLSWGLLWRNFPHLHATWNPSTHTLTRVSTSPGTHTDTFFMWKFEYPAVISTIFSTLLPFWTVSVCCGAYFMHVHISLCLSLYRSDPFFLCVSVCVWVRVVKCLTLAALNRAAHLLWHLRNSLCYCPTHATPTAETHTHTHVTMSQATLPVCGNPLFACESSYLYRFFQ